ncbi:MAG: ParA family protein [Desulfobacteraceae bacterium]|nr:ParA family protein [Desulfobacteraceae bacterium]
MSKVITIAGQRDKTGKSVTAVNLAASLALLEKKTLLIDCDSQANSTAWSGVYNSEDNLDLGALFSGRKEIRDIIHKTDLSFMYVLSSNINLYNIGLKLSKRADNQKMLRIFLKDIQDEYDYIIIDSPSASDFLSLTAMTASDWIIASIPCSSSFMSDLGDLLKMIKYIRKIHKIPLKFAGILVNRCDFSKDEIKSFFNQKDLQNVKDLVFKTFIPEDKSVNQTAELSKPVALCDAKSLATTKYLNLAQELITGFN